MSENEIKLKVNNNPQPYEITLKKGNSLFLLGSNGCGKSALLHHLFLQVKQRAKLILAYRNISFHSNGVSVIQNQRAIIEMNKKNVENKSSIRYDGGNLSQRVGLAMTDFINSENEVNKLIVNKLKSDGGEKALQIAQNNSPLSHLNNLLRLAGINLEIYLKKGELFAKKPDSVEYSIVQLSDGEKNVLLLCCNILTEKEGTVFFIDEPERHLHKSINSKLLRNLFALRVDCFFVVATHEIYIPIDNGASAIILVRKSYWDKQNVKSWDTDYIEEVNNIPEDFKETILGGKKRIVFVEGNNSNSLDYSIYQIIYPEITFKPVKNCRKVIESVRGMKNSSSIHHVIAYGIIDKDDRTDKQIADFLQEGILALPYYSVESIYYSPSVIREIINLHSTLTGNNATQTLEEIESAIILEIKSHKERLCKKMCEKIIRQKINSSLPTLSNINRGDNFNFQLSYDDIIIEEERKFEKMILEKDIVGLISRYPFRETGVINKIERISRINKSDYLAMVRKRLIDNTDFMNMVKNEMLRSITDILT